MKRQIVKLLTILSLLVGSSMAANAQFRYAAVAGFEMTNLKFKQDLVSVSQTPSYQVGVQGEMMFPGLGFGIDLGLIYNQLGAKVNLGERKIWASQGYGEERVRLHTLQIPLHLRFKWTRMNGVEDLIAPYVFGGPVFDFTIGHSKLDAMEYAGGSVGLQAGIGIELYKRWQIQASHVWGMTYALKAAKLQNFSAREDYWTVRLTYLF